MDFISGTVTELWLDMTSVGSVELGSVEGVGLHGGEVDVFLVFFLLRSGVSVIAHVSLWLDVIDLALLVDDNWLSVDVFDVTVVVVLLRVDVVAGWMSVMLFRSMVGVSVVLEALELLKLVPESSVLNGLDLGGLGECRLVGDGELLLLELDLSDGFVLRSVILVLVAGVVGGVPGHGASEEEGRGEGSHAV